MNEHDASEIFGAGSYEGLLAMLGLPHWATVGEAVFAMECRCPEVEGAQQWASYLCRSDLGVAR